MMVIILLACALLSFLLASFYNPQPPRINLVALGLSFYILSLLVQIKH